MTAPARPTEPEKVGTYPPFKKTHNAEWRSRIERRSNERYTRPRADIETSIERFLLGHAFNVASPD